MIHMMWFLFDDSIISRIGRAAKNVSFPWDPMGRTIYLHKSGQIIIFNITNLGFPEIEDFPYFSPPFGGPGRVRSL